MPYIRTKTFKNKDGSIREYLVLVEGTRVDGKVRQKVLATIGRIDELKKGGGLERLKASLDRFMGLEMNAETEQKSLDLVSAKKFGAVYFLEQIWEKLGYKKILNLKLGQKQQEALRAFGKEFRQNHLL